MTEGKLLSFEEALELGLINYIYEPENYWDDMSNRREFFVDFAETNNFDPLVSENWLSVDGSQFLSKVLILLSSYL